MKQKKQKIKTIEKEIMEEQKAEKPEQLSLFAAFFDVLFSPVQ
jgi:hypothetical protein